MRSILEELKQRDLLKQFTNEEKILNAQNEGAGVYCGFDPTADSLHVGHLIQIINLKRFKDFGFAPIAILGGATGMIGDPSFKSEERSLLTLEQVGKNVDGIKRQLNFLIPDINVINNNDWLGKMSLIDFLREIGKDFNLAYLLAKENIASRIEKGLSITEFSYTMLQGYDFFRLYEDQKCWMQIGGSDQWGNITSGTDYIASRVGRENSKACGITMNLLTKKDGVKFGKTESGAIWLDKDKTSEYEFYQFFVNQDDEDCEKLFKFLTTLPVDEINLIKEEHAKEPFKRIMQKRLAQEVTTFVHGTEGLAKAEKVTEALFSGDLMQLDKSELLATINSMPKIQVKGNLEIIDLIVESKIASSKREARELLNEGAISINNNNTFEENTIVDEKLFTVDNFIFIKKGKKKYFVVEII
ncbi:tyrosyl-tRNA synthetase [Spiroplasma monobiae MQ-1]|uniref:Tyrosine--tRNA ligase n=2 Tax=Spiroplasma monobiae (strain ATCC 33825 / MQ-1) TaxID=2136 RepID=A0A2K9LVI4_SPISQ|nr:tyrosine--tRNA ligase [Spiroplasma monobiae]AUM62941.1 tyrosyl-tRNA synthetase [Spiroplasma monobiae MQ-1]